MLLKEGEALYVLNRIEARLEETSYHTGEQADQRGWSSYTYTRRHNGTFRVDGYARHFSGRGVAYKQDEIGQLAVSKSWECAMGA